MGAHKCACTTCSTQIMQGILFCPYHWRLLPPDMRQAIYWNWAAIKDCRADQLKDCLDKYKACVVKAQEFLDGKKDVPVSFTTGD